NTVRACHRSEHAFPDGVEPVRADVREPDSLVAACDGAHTVVSCLGNRRYFGRGGMHSVDVIGTRNLVRAAESAGVKHLILLSAFGLDRRSIFLSMFSGLLNRYFHHKQLVEDAVRASTIPFTVVRPHELRNRETRGMPVL